MASVRAFVAVHLDLATRAAIATAVDELRRHAGKVSVAWVAPDNFHLTLKFLGAIEEPRVDEVSAALVPALRRHARFAIEVAGLGAFPSATRPRVLWAGVRAGGETLGAVAATVDDTLASCGFAPEDRAFSAHVTVGRVRESPRAPALADALRAAADRPFGRVTIDEVTLMRSDLSPHGAHYTSLATFPLC